MLLKSKRPVILQLKITSCPGIFLLQKTLCPVIFRMKKSKRPVIYSVEKSHRPGAWVPGPGFNKFCSLPKHILGKFLFQQLESF